jgi:hypothetical protein
MGAALRRELEAEGDSLIGTQEMGRTNKPK